MTDVKNIKGHFYPVAHPGWGSFAEELFHYTSRYYCATEAFLRTLAADEAFTMSGYKAARMSTGQRDLMAAVLSGEPSADAAATVISIVNAVQRGDPEVEQHIAAAYAERLQNIPKHEIAEHLRPAPIEETGEVDPPDPFLSLAEHLLMPVTVRDHHVEVSMHDLARHLQSPNSTVRSNLQNAIIALHDAGYVLRNHPHLTHSEAQQIDDEQKTDR